MVSRLRLGALATALFLLSYWAFATPAPRWRNSMPPPPLPRADESGYAAVNGIHMFYEIFGKGRGDPVLLIHGGMGSSEAWGFEVPELAKTHEVIIADSRGHGRSTRLRKRPMPHRRAFSMLTRRATDRTLPVISMTRTISEPSAPRSRPCGATNRISPRTN